MCNYPRPKEKTWSLVLWGNLAPAQIGNFPKEIFRPKIQVRKTIPGPNPPNETLGTFPPFGLVKGKGIPWSQTKIRKAQPPKWFPSEPPFFPGGPNP